MERYRQGLLPYARWMRLGISLFVGLLAGFGASSSWRTFLLWVNRVNFGETDPQFHKDIGFYFFELPFFDNIVSWIWFALIACRCCSPSPPISSTARSARMRAGRRRIGGPGPHLGAPRSAGPHQGGLVLARALPVELLQQRSGHGRQLHRRKRPAACPEPAHHHLDHLGGSLPREHPRSPLDPSGGRGGSVASRSWSSPEASSRGGCSVSRSAPRSPVREAPFIERNIAATRRGVRDQRGRIGAVRGERHTRRRRHRGATMPSFRT